MATSRAGVGKGWGGVCLAAVTMVAAWCGSAAGFTPDSPEVRAMVEKGLKYLETNTDARVGGKALIGLAFYKNGAHEDHPKVKEGIDACLRAAGNSAENIQMDIYSTGIAIIFLCEINPSKYRIEIERLINSLELRQKECGGWGYPGGPHMETGDTSMTQYAVLSMWTASRAGIIEVPIPVVEKVCQWLIRTQDPSGGWGYQGADPGIGNTERLPQTSVRQSLTAAGLGSAIICADLLGFIAPLELEEDNGLPPSLALVKRDVGNKAVVLAQQVDGRQLRNTINDGNGWFGKNYVIDPPQWPYYYMYALERYKSFYEKMHSGRFADSPGWYNDGVKFLQKAQREDGSWFDQYTEVDTAFAILFLLRSTMKSIEGTVHDTGTGTLLGGQGLPSDVSQLQVRGGRIVGQPKQGEPDELLAILEDPEHPDFEYTVDFPADFKLSQEPQERARQLAQLRRLVRVESNEARRVAVQMLARSRDLDVVPELIYALSDPDWRVVKEARDGLRFISRRFAGFGLPDQPTQDETLRAIDSWKKWYLSVRPGSEFFGGDR